MQVDSAATLAQGKSPIGSAPLLFCSFVGRWHGPKTEFWESQNPTVLATADGSYAAKLQAYVSDLWAACSSFLASLWILARKHGSLRAFCGNVAMPRRATAASPTQLRLRSCRLVPKVKGAGCKRRSCQTPRPANGQKNQICGGVSKW